MKKLVLLLFVLPLVFMSCSDDKDDDKDDDMENPNFLNGTVWTGEDMNEDDIHKNVFTLSFQKSTLIYIDEVHRYDSEKKEWYDINDTGRYSGTYTYNPPYAKAILNNGTDDDEKATIIVSGKTLTFQFEYDDDDEPYVITLTRKK